MKSELTIEDIPRMLKRYSFDAKMSICYEFSRRLLKYSHQSIDDDFCIMPQPWEIETFLLCALIAMPEYGEMDFSGKNCKKFQKMIEAIRNILPKDMTTSLSSNRYIGRMALYQFDFQEYIYYKLYRYSYIFSFANEKIDVKSIFTQRFGVTYDVFIHFAVVLNLLCESGIEWARFPGIIEYLFNTKYKNVFFQLTINKNIYNEKIKENVSSIEDYLFCYKESFQKPFVESDSKIYLPTPHLLYRAITSSLYYRLTDSELGNNKLRGLMGKEVLESYLFQILNSSCAYDEIYAEKKFFGEHKQEMATADVLLREDNNIVFVDSKSSVPSCGLRIGTDNAYEKAVEISAVCIKKLYNQVRVFYEKYESYKIFKKNMVFPKERRWGIVAMLEDNYVFRENIYLAAANKLGIQNCDEEYDWMINHIKIVSFFDIEKFALSSRSILKPIIKQKDSGRPFDYSLSEEGKEKKMNTKEYRDFFNQIKNDCFEETEEMYRKGLFNRKIGEIT